MRLDELCDLIQLPDSVKEKVMNHDQCLDMEGMQGILVRLLQRESWNQAYEDLKTALGEDSDGMKILTVMLKEALHTYERYNAFLQPIHPVA